MAGTVTGPTFGGAVVLRGAGHRTRPQLQMHLRRSDRNGIMTLAITPDPPEACKSLCEMKVRNYFRRGALVLTLTSEI